MIRLLLLLATSLQAQLTLRPGDWVDIAVKFQVTSGTLTSASWVMSVPRQFAEPSINLVGTNQSRVTCKKKASECNWTGIYGAGFNNEVAMYRYIIPDGSGPWTLKINKKTSIGGVVNVSIQSGIKVSISPGVVTVKPGESVQFTSTVTGTSNTGWNTPNPPAPIPPLDTITIRIRP